MIKKIFMLIVSISLISCVSTNLENINSNIKITGNYNLGLIPAELDYNVLLYIPTIPVGVSSVVTNNLSDIEIKSNESKKFNIISFESMNLLEAIKSDNTTYSYFSTKYSLNELGLNKTKNLTNTGVVNIQDLLDLMIKSDMSVESIGDPTEPDLEKFDYLRVVYLINIIVNDSDNKEYKLQVCVENFHETSNIDLR